MNGRDAAGISIKALISNDPVTWALARVRGEEASEEDLSLLDDQIARIPCGSPPAGGYAAMRYIQKGPEPPELTEYKALANADWRPTYRDLDKKPIRTALTREQGYHGFRGSDIRSASEIWRPTFSRPASRRRARRRPRPAAWRRARRAPSTW